jgi:NAD(P)-dependent dehydrogenase (short-subunit alcohol dehydrogenase family)
MMHAVLPLMKSHRSGVIINITCPASIGDVSRTAARDGLLGATKSVAWRCRDEGIRVNAVLPGAVEEAGEKIAATEVARAVLFLVSEEARGVNAVGLPVGRVGEVI